MEDTGSHTGDQQRLDFDFSVNNCTIDSERLCVVLLVFGTVRRPVRTTTTTAQLANARLFNEDMKEVEKEQAYR